MITKQYTDRIYTNDNNQYLSQMGWTFHFQTQLEKFDKDEFIPARVVGVRKTFTRMQRISLVKSKLSLSEFRHTWFQHWIAKGWPFWNNIYLQGRLLP